MQKTTKTMFIAAIVVMTMMLPCGASKKWDETQIPLRSNSEYLENPGGPRIPSATRVEAYYNSETCTVSVYLTNAGTSVAIDIINLYTNETHSSTVPGSGSSVLPISGNAGCWTITFTLDDGRVYDGWFNL